MDERLGSDVATLTGRTIRRTGVAAMVIALAMVAQPAQAQVAAQSVSVANAPTGLDANGHLLAVPMPAGRGFAWARLRNGVQLRVGSVTKNLIFHGPATVRVNANSGRNYWTAPSIVVTGKPADVAMTVRETADRLTIATAKLVVTADRRTGALTFADPAGKVYTRENAADPQSVKPVQISGAPSYEVENRLTLKPGEAIYGFGFTDDLAANRRGRALTLVQTNIGIIIPVMVSTERFGILWDTYSQMRSVVMR